jgi:hypothetical protein
VLLDLEPVDPFAGGYVWTAVDGSLAIAVPNVWHNAAEPFDVDGDGRIAPVDALTLINWLNANPGQSALPIVSGIPAAYVDVDNDRACTASDVLAVINQLNAQAALAVPEGEPGDGAWAAAVGGRGDRRSESAGDPGAVFSAADVVAASRRAAPTGLGETGLREIPRAERAVCQEDVRDLVFRDAATDLTLLGPVLAELANDIAAAWR